MELSRASDMIRAGSCGMSGRLGVEYNAGFPALATVSYT